MTEPDPAEQRAADRVERGDAARQRADEAGVRAAELRTRLDEAMSGERTTGSTDEQLSRSREHAESADTSMRQALARAASAHDRAAGLHERRAEEDGTEQESADHARHAQEHRAAAAADRDLAQQRNQPEPPAE